MQAESTGRHRRPRPPRRTISPLAAERLEPRISPGSLAPSVLEQVLLERINDLRVRGRRTPLALQAQMSHVALQAEPANVPQVKSMLTKNGVPWLKGDSITTGISGRGVLGGSTAADITRIAEELAKNHPLTGSLGSKAYNRHRMVGLAVSNPGPPESYDLVTVRDVTASITGGRSILTGVAFRDSNGNRLYDAGEGMRGVRVTATGPQIRATVRAWRTGGFSLPLSTSRSVTVTVTASAPELDQPLTQTVRVRPGFNARVNFVVTALPPAPRPVTPADA